MATIEPRELIGRIQGGERPRILDVRSPAEFAAGHVPGAVNVPFSQVAERIDRVRGAGAGAVVVYCGHGPRAWMAARALRRLGYTDIRYLRGHWARWRRARLPVER
jgi:rhodanese-related sulfurtransferase